VTGEPAERRNDLDGRKDDRRPSVMALFVLASICISIGLIEAAFSAGSFDGGGIRIGDGKATYIGQDVIGGVSLLLGITLGLAALRLRCPK
jgi:hypothetical protein